MSTLWLIFSAGWLDINKAPPDAADWLNRGYLPCARIEKAQRQIRMEFEAEEAA